MRLDDYCELFERSRFPNATEREHPEREAVVEARHALAPALLDDDFLTDCIELEMERMAGDDGRPGLAAFYTIPDLGIRFAFGYWPPGATAGPHEHTAWTITAVCRNELEVFTFDRDASYRTGQLVTKNRFDAPAGRTGFIYEPCIHEPRNPTSEWSLSLHVLSPRDGELLTDYEQCIPELLTPQFDIPASHPYLSVMANRRRFRLAGMLGRTLEAMGTARSAALLPGVARLGGAATRRYAARDVPERWTLARAHSELALSARLGDGRSGLYASTPRGDVQELRLDARAHMAMEFVARETTFEVRSLPGSLSDEERTAIAESLEDSGLFRRMDI